MKATAHVLFMAFGWFFTRWYSWAVILLVFIYASVVFLPQPYRLIFGIALLPIVSILSVSIIGYGIEKELRKEFGEFSG